MTVWDLDRVLALAPDAGSLAVARRLEQGSWADLGHSERGVWGRCRGSGSQPYQTVVDVGDDGAGSPAYACSCPSRKRPCKHVLGLLILWSTGRVRYTETEAGYAAEWLDGRAWSTARPADRSQPVDAAAAERRAAARVERVAAGLEELDRWLADQVHGGLAGMERAGYGHFEAIAARMVDAQAPGVASLLRAIPGELARPGWPERVLALLAGLHLLVRAHQRIDMLPADLAATARSRIGYTVARNDVLAGPGVHDRWLALGAVDTVEFQLETRRVWLFGLSTRRWGMWLTFAPPGQQLDTSVVPGQALDGDLHFYPGSGQHRVLLGDRVPFDGFGSPAGDDLAAVHRRFADLLAADPWAGRMPALVDVRAVPPASAGESWRVRDASGAVVDLEPLPGEPWPLLAHSAGGEASVFGEWTGHRLRPLSVLADGELRTQVWL